MKILIFGDIYGRNGRRLIKKFLPEIRAQYAPDFIIGNSENMTSGKGPKLHHIHEFEHLGFDCLTGGNHLFKNIAEIQAYMNTLDSIQIRPENYYRAPGYSVPGHGYRFIQKTSGTLLVINLMSSVFLHDGMDNPFLRVDELIKTLTEDGKKWDALVVDFHRETSSELYCMAEYLSGRATFVYGTHTHVQTNDEHILASGTGMITDVGMVGPIHSAIGDQFPDRLKAFVTGTRLFSGKPQPDMGHGAVHAVLVDVEHGKCTSIEKIRIREADNTNT
jgi:metallophosphoesterase (TIGR00282 family)